MQDYSIRSNIEAPYRPSCVRLLIMDATQSRPLKPANYDIFKPDKLTIHAETLLRSSSHAYKHITVSNPSVTAQITKRLAVLVFCTIQSASN